MNVLKLYGKEVTSIFQLVGYSEDAISYSIAWVLANCDSMLALFIEQIFGTKGLNLDDTEMLMQEYDFNGRGITDIELKSGDFHIIVEAKKGWILPGRNQLEKYAGRDTFVNNDVKLKSIVTLSECSQEYAEHNLEVKAVSGIDVIHISWKDIYSITDTAKKLSNNHQKRLLNELQTYLRGLTTMQNNTSNEVYVVSVGGGYPNGCEITWIDIVEKRNKYFHPVGGKGWPKEPPNYIAFRYRGRLQSIHHIEEYVITKNISDEIEEMPDVTSDEPHFVYTLGSRIEPNKEVKTGKIYPSGRVWSHLDLLLTCDTISDARDMSQQRMSKV